MRYRIEAVANGLSLRNLRAGLVAIANRIPAPLARRLHGQGHLARYLRPLVNKVMPAEILEVQVRSGLAQGTTILINPRSEKYYWSGTYEPAVQAALADLLEDGDVMWDVGAHIGFHTAIASRLVGVNGEVVAFEPFGPNLVRLERLVALNRMDNVKIRPVAVSGTTGSTPFHVASSTSMGRLTPGAAATGDIQVRTTTLDNELAAHRPPVLVKIDVEGAEAAVLGGAASLLSEVRPRLIVELLTADAAASAQEMLPQYRFIKLDDHNFLGEACSPDDAPLQVATNQSFADHASACRADGQQ